MLLSKSEKAIFRLISEKAEIVFYNPSPLYSYCDIIEGCLVKNPFNGEYKKMSAVDNNTWRGFRGFHPKEVFTGYFLKNKTQIINNLKNINSEIELDDFEDVICSDIRKIFIETQGRIDSYNKIRKPVDLYIENIACMSQELSEVRNKLVEFLFLPLDSQILGLYCIFSDSQLRALGVRRSGGFGNIVSRNTYFELQKIIKSRAKEISNELSIKFDRIYFDLLWNERFLKKGNNLFETSFKQDI